MTNLTLRQLCRLPKHRGKQRLVTWLGRHLFPDEGIRAKVFPEVWLHLHPRDWIEYLLLTTGEYEPFTLDFLTRNLRAGDEAVLAGVNFGLHVAVAARAVGTSGKVLGVDPQPAALLRTRGNLALNGLLEQVQLVSGGIGGSDRYCPMAWSRPDNPGAASVYDSGNGFITRIARAPEVFRAAGLGAPRVFLLDVQGCEVEVLLGLGKGPVPDIAIVEHSEEYLRMAGTTGLQLMDRLLDLGYSLFDVHGRPLSREDRVMPEHNVFGVKPGVSPLWVPEAT